MFDHNGVPSTVEDWVGMIRRDRSRRQAYHYRRRRRSPSRRQLSDDPVRDYLGDFGHLSLGEGIKATFDTFQTMLRNDVITADAIR